MSWSTALAIFEFVTLFFLVESLLFKLTHRQKDGESTQPKSFLSKRWKGGQMSSLPVAVQENSVIVDNNQKQYTTYQSESRVDTQRKIHVEDAVAVDADAFLDECEVHIQNKDYFNAATLLQWFVDTHQDNVRAINMLLDVYQELKDIPGYSRFI